MKLFDTDIVVQRGEAFQLNFEILTPQQTPYIIPADIDNPYFVLTVTSSGNYTKGRYKKDWWMKVDDTTPRFKETDFIDLTKFTTTNGGTTHPYSNWNNVGKLSEISGYYPDRGLWQLDLTSWNNGVYTECVFGCIDSSTGKMTYKYWYSEVEQSSSGSWIDYDLILSFIIMPSDSQEWISQNYLYGVSLQAGKSTEEAYSEFRETGDPTFADIYGHSYEYILNNYPDLASRLAEDEKLLVNITNSIPLYSIDYVVPIVEPSKLTVNTNLKGGILK